MTSLQPMERDVTSVVLSWGEPAADSPPPAAEPRVLLRVEEAAHRLGIERTLMYELVGSGAVESVRIGRLRRIPVDCLDEFVTRLRAGWEEEDADG